MTSPATRRTALPALLALLAGTALAGCGALTDDDASGNGRRIVAAFYPLHYVAERVAGEHFDVELLTTPGQEPHDLTIGPRQTAEIADAAVVLIERGFQPAVDATVEQNASGVVIDAADVLELREFADHSEEGHSEEGHSEEEEEEEHADDEHADEEENADEEDAHGHEGDLDPHFWLDPLLMADLGDALAQKLGEVDGDHAVDFSTNAEALRTDMEKLDQEFTAGLDSCERDLVVVNHDAFGYLARYGLHLEPISGFSPGAEPSAADLGRLQQLIKDEGVTTVFAETLVSKKTTDSLASDLGIKTGVLDPIEGLTDETADEDYLSLMRANLSSIQAANNC